MATEAEARRWIGIFAHPEEGIYVHRYGLLPEWIRLPQEGEHFFWINIPTDHQPNHQPDLTINYGPHNRPQVIWPKDKRAGSKSKAILKRLQVMDRIETTLPPLHPPEEVNDAH